MRKIAALLLAGLMSVSGGSSTYAQQLPSAIAAEVEAAALDGDVAIVAALIEQYPSLAAVIAGAALVRAPAAQKIAMAATLVSAAPANLRSAVAVAAVQSVPSSLKAQVASAVVGAVAAGQQTSLAMEIVKTVPAADAAAVTGALASTVPEASVASLVQASVEAHAASRTEIEAAVSDVAQDRGFSPDTVTQIANAAAAGSGETPDIDTGALDQGPLQDPDGSPS